MLGIGLLAIFGPTLLSLAAVLFVFPTVPGSLMDNETIALAISVLVLAGVVWLAVSVLVRGSLHRQKVSGSRPVPPESFTDVPNPQWSWRSNKAVFPKRMVTVVAVAVVATALDLVLVFLIASSSFPASLGMLGAGIVLATLFGSIAALVAALPWSVPSEVAVADDGIHFWYDSPYDRRTAREVLSWTDLNVLRSSTPGGADPITRLVRFLRIDSENAQIIASEWPLHRAVRPSSPRTQTPPRKGEGSGTPSPERTFPHVMTPIATETSRSQRGVACVRCRVRYPGLEGFRLLWCKVDHFYVCRNCWREGCQEGHGRGIKATSKPSRILGAVVLGVAFLAIWYPAVSYDYNLTNAWRNTNPTPIADLTPGEIAKVDGTILSSSLVAWGGHEVYYSKTGWSWTWNTTDNFELGDATGTLLVATGAWYLIYNGPHMAWWAPHTTMWVYERGDRVQIVGSVSRLGNGTLHLDAQIASQAAAVPLITLEPSVMSAALLLLIPSLIGAISVAGAVVLLARRVRSRRALHGQPMLALDASAESRDPNRSWIPNGRGTTPRKRGVGAMGVVLGGVALLAVYPGLGPRADSGYWGLGFIGTIVVLSAGLFSYMLLFGGVGRPSYVAIDDVGFRMWFESPYDRHLSDTVFPWAEIQDIHMTSGKGAHWVLRWTTGEVVNLYMLRRSNLNLLLQEWARRGSRNTDPQRT